MGIWEYNGSTVVAMTGKDCVAIGCDMRLGINQFQTVSADFPKSFQLNDRCFVAFAGLATDVQTLHNEMKFRHNVYRFREERDMSVEVASNTLSSMLYAHRWSPFIVASIVAGLSPNTNKPFLSSFDFIGAACLNDEFVVGGTATEQLVGLCESFYKPDMDEAELSETVSQCLMAAIDRDCVSGWGATVNIITPEKIVTRRLKTRMD